MVDIPWDFQLDESVEGRILGRTVERIKALQLPAISNNVEIRKLPWLLGDNDTLKTPCIIVSPAPEDTNWQQGTNERNDMVFSTFISAILANGRDISTRGMGLQLYWREQLRRAFVNKAART